MLPRVINRLNKDLAALYDAAKAYKPEYVFSKTKEGFVLPIDDDVKYSVIADVDSFLFEVRACADLMQKFFGLLHAHTGKPIPEKKLGESFQAALQERRVSEGWFKMLAKARNLAAHDGTPYVAIDISRSKKWAAIFTMENLKSFEDPNKFFTISDLQEIADGFRKAKIALQDHLVELFR